MTLHEYARQRYFNCTVTLSVHAHQNLRQVHMYQAYLPYEVKLQLGPVQQRYVGGACWLDITGFGWWKRYGCYSYYRNSLESTYNPTYTVTGPDNLVSSACGYDAADLSSLTRPVFTSRQCAVFRNLVSRKTCRETHHSAVLSSRSAAAAMTEKSYPKGSAFPPLTKGKLRLYSMRFCPFAQRTRLVLAQKRIPHETVNVDLKEKPEWFLERNPLGMVPTLEQDDKVVYESLITCDYLDDVYPQNRLTPADPYRKAQDAMLVDYYGSKCIPNYYKVMRTEGKDEEAKETLTKALQKLDEEVSKRGKFFGGEQVAMIDFMLWPWFERIGLLKSAAPDLLPSATKFPKLFAWTQAMLQEPAVKATLFDLDTHMIFVQSYKDGKPNYDIGLER